MAQSESVSLNAWSRSVYITQLPAIALSTEGEKALSHLHQLRILTFKVVSI